MFKSIFAKYVTVFAALLLSGFLLLLVIFGSVVGHYAENTWQATVLETSRSAAAVLTDMLRDSGEAELETLIRAQESEARRVLRAVLTNANGVTICVTDPTGKCLLTVGDAEEITVEADDAMRVTGSSDISLPLALHAEKDNELRYGSAILGYLSATDGEGFSVAPTGAVGAVIAVAPVLEGGRFPYSSFETVLLAALWVMIAALIALYFITERTIDPLRDMSRAAKKLAVGSFDTHVPVRGRDEVAQLAVAFNQMSDSLNSMERMRSAFIANVSHDLRTPMTTIAGFIDGILDGVIPPEEQEHYLRVVSGEVRRLSRLVNQLLDISRLQAGDRKLVKYPFDICEMGRQILISFEQKIDTKRLEVSFDCESDRMFVLGDQDAVHQILYNICDNAVKFSSEGGRLAMHIAWQKSPGGGVRKALVRVYNEGQGIPPEDLPYIFERFYKSDKSRSLDRTGVGLGMYIAKTIIEAHGEHISVNSEYGKDCEFSFTLPESAPPEGRSREQAGADTPPAKKARSTRKHEETK